MKRSSENYFDLVYEVVKLIPTGRVCTYGAIANYLGLKSGARMVGYAMNAAHGLPEVPAHRVVNRQGVLTGKHHFSSPEMMQNLLENEGVTIENDQVLDFDHLFWDPSRALL
ncbi:MGMT family protein [Belliella kenyensis]|uniref:MGMT family protein n=1 Tax=Belliella kenyensis TaxID=1472724 RepID=A0ABV8EKI6_9BACT|nr:MGMT family protein [Belliella kenyensis]MCH7401267.1 MGMT family protein [Belliella kenyensis]MDN3602712.1 MGMT family protein [Belliella kenyensis]